jgi:hypothetical protein
MKYTALLTFLTFSVFAQQVPPGYLLPVPVPNVGSLPNSFSKPGKPVGPTSFSDTYPQAYDVLINGALTVIGHTNQIPLLPPSTYKEGKLLVAVADKSLWMIDNPTTKTSHFICYLKPETFASFANFYTTDGALASSRTVDMASKNLTYINGDNFEINANKIKVNALNDFTVIFPEVTSGLVPAGHVLTYIDSLGHVAPEPLPKPLAFVDPSWFGSFGSNPTNNRIILENAIASANGKPVIILGDVVIDRLNLNTGINPAVYLKGYNQKGFKFFTGWVSRLRLMPNATQPLITVGDQVKIQIDDLMLFGDRDNQTNANLHGIVISPTAGAPTFKNVLSHKNNGNGVHILHSEGYMYGVVAHHNAGHGIYDNGAEVDLHDLDLAYNDGYGLYATGAAGTRLTGSDVYQNKLGDLYVSGSDGFTASHSRFEQSFRTCVQIDGTSQRSRFDHCLFRMGNIQYNQFGETAPASPSGTYPLIASTGTGFQQHTIFSACEFATTLSSVDLGTNKVNYYVSFTNPNVPGGLGWTFADCLGFNGKDTSSTKYFDNRDNVNLIGTLTDENGAFGVDTQLASTLKLDSAGLVLNSSQSINTGAAPDYPLQVKGLIAGSAYDITNTQQTVFGMFKGNNPTPANIRWGLGIENAQGSTNSGVDFSLLSYDNSGSAISERPLMILRGQNKVGIAVTGASAITHQLTIQGGTGDAAKPGGGSWSVYSDSRLKNIAGNFTNSWDVLSALSPKVWSYSTNSPFNATIRSRTYYGANAQDLLSTILSNTVSSVTMNINGTNVDRYTYDPSALIWVLINSVNDLKAKQDSHGW